MKCALLQMNLAENDADTNISTAERLMQSHPHADVYVLPEMWATGFVTSPSDATFAAAKQALAWMQRKAVEQQCCIAGSLPVREDNHSYNRFYWIAPDGTTTHYDKRHVFTPGGEGQHYATGERRVVVPCCGVRFLLLVCYDLRFPVFARNRGDYDVMLCVASWPAARAHVWDLLLRARAVENQCYAIGVNRVGTDRHGNYSGGSVCVDAYGRNLTPSLDGEGVLVCNLDMESLQAFRQKFPVLDDADSFTIDGLSPKE